ncbi:MAG: SDR family oxidoreductase [Elusimicrobia bacterium]|nr:SDR family oxidoreductase [Elusimicrobiota bacterium]
MKLKNLCGIVTGGGTGIGKAIAQQVIKEGGKVLITGRRAEALEKTAQELGGDAIFCEAGDIRQAAPAAAIAEKALGRLGKLDFLVNNAGIMKTKNSHDVTEEDFQDEVNTNFKGAFFISQAVIKIFRAQKSGQILYIASASALVASPKMAVYAASKAALVSLTQSFALEYAKEGIRVNCLCPGTVDTGLMPKAMAALMIARHPIGRLGAPQDIGVLAAHVLSPENSWMTGSIITIDGGVTL